MRRLRGADLQDGRYPPGHRAHHRPGAGHDPARHDHRLRRQPHRHPWRLRGAGIRHRHLGGGARPGHPDPDAAAGEEPAHLGRRRLGQRGHRQGFDPGDHRRDRHGRRHRPCHRICRPGDPRPLHGRPHDDLQHVDRGRCPGRADRAGRDDVRIPEGPADGAQGRAVGDGRGLLAHPAVGPRRPLRPGGGAERGRHRADGDLGHQPAGCGADHRRRPRSRQPGATRPAPRRRAARSTIWGSRPELG